MDGTWYWTMQYLVLLAPLVTRPFYRTMWRMTCFYSQRQQIFLDLNAGSLPGTNWEQKEHSVDICCLIQGAQIEYLQGAQTTFIDFRCICVCPFHFNLYSIHFLLIVPVHCNFNSLFQRMKLVTKTLVSRLIFFYVIHTS